MSGPPLWDFVTTDVVHLVKLLQCQFYHRCGSRTYEWGYCRNSQRNKGSELDKKRRNLGKKTSNLDKNVVDDLEPKKET